MFVQAVDRPDVPQLQMPARFKRDITYFMTPPGERGAPNLSEGEYWISATDARAWLQSGVLELISPLDSEHRAEVEITEEQEAWLEWLLAHGVERVRLVG